MASFIWLYQISVSEEKDDEWYRKGKEVKIKVDVYEVEQLVREKIIQLDELLILQELSRYLPIALITMIDNLVVLQLMTYVSLKDSCCHDIVNVANDLKSNEVLDNILDLGCLSHLDHVDDLCRNSSNYFHHHYHIGIVVSMRPVEVVRVINCVSK